MQPIRKFTKTAFFLLFLFAPILDVFRFDLTVGHFIIFGQEWALNIENILAGDSLDAAVRVFSRVLIPLLTFIGITGFLIWRYGRIYCGWLCPHFSVVEMFNQLMFKFLHRTTLWEKPTKANQGISAKLIIAIPSILMAFVWAVGLLGYLVPPKELLTDLVNLELDFGAQVFIITATIIFSFDFIFTRHVFCKYGCALGLFQSLIWMANKKAMVIKFDRQRAKVCRECSLNMPQKACDAACPMRLPTRNMKRAKFTCTQCGQCIEACSGVQKQSFHADQLITDTDQKSLLNWVSGDDAIDVDRPAGKYSADIEIIEITKSK